MPRASRRTAPDVAFHERAQPATAPTGLPYGQHGAAMQAQKSLPVAGAAVDLASIFQKPTAPDAITAGAGGTPTGQFEQPQNAQDHAATVAQFANGLVPIGLTGPSTRPTEPVTAGLTSGAGAGPEGLTLPQDSAAATLYAIAQATNDPTFWDLAEQAARSGQ